MINIDKIIKDSSQQIGEFATNIVAKSLNTPVRVVGYGQKPFMPFDPQISNFNAYILSIVQSLYGGILGTVNKLNLPENMRELAGNIQYILDKIDLPISSRLIMFQAYDSKNPTWRYPLVILPVNPNTLKVDYNKKSSIHYTLGGFVVTHWHDDVITLTAQGYIPSFKGKSKILSESYQYFLKLLNLYLSCGKIDRIPVLYENIMFLDSNKLLNPEITSIETGIEGSKLVKQLSAVVFSLNRSTILLRYQDDVYHGIFTKFSIDESYDLPNTLQYSFTFIAMNKTNILFDSLAEPENFLVKNILSIRL